MARLVDFGLPLDYDEDCCPQCGVRMNHNELVATKLGLRLSWGVLFGICGGLLLGFVIHVSYYGWADPNPERITYLEKSYFATYPVGIVSGIVAGIVFLCAMIFRR